MQTAITATGPTLDSNVDPRFGRCAYFLIVDVDTMEFQVIENPNGALGQGAGIQSAGLLAGKGVDVLLTGYCGPKAHEALSAADVEVLLGCSGISRDALEEFKAGKLKPAGESNVAAHAGMADATPSLQEQSTPSEQSQTSGSGITMGRGRPGGGGGGKGMGGGMGRGMGRGRGQGRGCGGAGQGRTRGNGGGTE